MDLLRFAADLDRISVSRRWVVDRAARDGADVVALRTLALLTTEAVTNAIKHGPDGGEVTVTLSADVAGWRVAVTDESPVLPSRLDVDARAAGGRGVMLIDHLAAEWGVDVAGSGKTVWFRVARSPRGPAPGSGSGPSRRPGAQP